jgi:hypothetical protein
MDDRSIIAILVGAIKNLWSNVAALMQSDEAQNARIQQLEEEVAALKSRSAAAREHPHTPTSAPRTSHTKPPRVRTRSLLNCSL